MFKRSCGKDTEVIAVEDRGDGLPTVAAVARGHIGLTLARVYYDLQGVLCDTGRSRLIPITVVNHEYEDVDRSEFSFIR